MMLHTRVTEVLHPFSGLDKVPKEILDAAADRGKRVHSYFDLLLAGKIKALDYLSPDTFGYQNSLLDWMDSTPNMIKPVRWFDEKLMLTGEADALYFDEAEQGWVIVDIKTSSKEGKWWPLQGSAYKYLVEQTGLKISGIQFVHLKKDGKAPTVYHYQDNFPMFKACYDVYKFFYENKKDQGDLEYL